MLNAWLCFAGLPVEVRNADFDWHVIPAGAIHGALLAAIAFSTASSLSEQSVGIRLLASLVVGWVAGFISWVPLNLSAFDEPWRKSVSWPFHEGVLTALLIPLVYFGLVALVYYLAVALGNVEHRRAGFHVLGGSLAGVLGSLWFWIGWERWYFSIIHGVIWGSCVGVAAWSAARTRSATA